MSTSDIPYRQFARLSPTKSGAQMGPQKPDDALIVIQSSLFFHAA
jgi:hypothetical protein